MLIAHAVCLISHMGSGENDARLPIKIPRNPVVFSCSIVSGAYDAGYVLE